MIVLVRSTSSKSRRGQFWLISHLHRHDSSILLETSFLFHRLLTGSDITWNFALLRHIRFNVDRLLPGIDLVSFLQKSTIRLHKLASSNDSRSLLVRITEFFVVLWQCDNRHKEFPVITHIWLIKGVGYYLAGALIPIDLVELFGRSDSHLGDLGHRICQLASRTALELTVCGTESLDESLTVRISSAVGDDFHGRRRELLITVREFALL